MKKTGRFSKSMGDNPFIRRANGEKDTRIQSFFPTTPQLAPTPSLVVQYRVEKPVGKGKHLMKLSVIGCGRWGTFLAWYLERSGSEVTLYGRKGSKRMEQLLSTRSNGEMCIRDSNCSRWTGYNNTVLKRNGPHLFLRYNVLPSSIIPLKLKREGPAVDLAAGPSRFLFFAKTLPIHFEIASRA